MPRLKPRPGEIQAHCYWSLSGLFSRLGRLIPLSKPCTRDDIVWLLDNTAFQSAPGAAWHAEFVAAVFEREDKARLVDVVTGVARVRPDRRR